MKVYDITKEDWTRIYNTYTYHYPDEEQGERYTLLRDNAKQLAYDILSYCPSSRERSLALTKLEEVIMWANKSIAVNE